MAEFHRDDEHPAPPTVVAAVACATVPVPFLAVYAVLFLVHGSVHPVIPPDITSTTRGEFWSGVVAAVLFVLCSTALIWAITGRRRWPFVLVNIVLLAAALYFLVDGDKGGDVVSVLVALACLAALVLAFLPMSGRYYGGRAQVGERWRARRHGRPDRHSVGVAGTEPDA